MTMHAVERHDSRRLDLGDGIEIEVCRRDDRFGKGPCVSVWADGLEELRLDLFEDRPHLHVRGMPGDAPRVELSKVWTRIGHAVERWNNEQA